MRLRHFSKQTLFKRSALLAWLLSSLAFSQSEPVSLFDGKTLEGWKSTKGVWRVEDGCITAGSYTKKFPKNEFICTEKSYANFDLTLTIKCSGDLATGQVNSGIQIRSARLPDGGVAGYQIDCGKGWFGKIYDEHRRRLIYPKPIDEPTLLKSVDTFGWNTYRILAEGPRIQVWINDVKASDFTETNPNIPLNGIIAPQIHKGGHVMVQFKDVTIKELPPTTGAPTWESLGGTAAALAKVKKPAPNRKPRAKPKADPKTTPKSEPKPSAAAKATGEEKFIYLGSGKKDTSYNNVEGDPRPATEQLKAFNVPEGYELELVVQESEGMGKFISVYFDQQGRLWTQTALEYPVDGNQNATVAEALYKRRARDKVLVYSRESLADLPAGGLTSPTVFADGLAMPLGILPWGKGDSAYVLHGPDLVHLKDTDGDGVSDERKVVLTGMGIQDSHLFPHQFTRAPNDWIWLAQGLFNSSEVRVPGERRAVSWPKCSLARMRADGSNFEVMTYGPHNLWGLTISGEGETFIQEANDFGYPVMPYHEYAYYPKGMAAYTKSYQPTFPPSTEFRMGGTSLCGLSILEHGPAVNAEADHTMLVANPILSKVQILGMHRDGPRWDFEKLDDLLTCDDPFFRPIAMTQGPDACLYIVDWYNKVISHNEVARNHPDRDKTRGRIWRLKPTAGRLAIPDFSALKSDELIAMLGEKPTGRAHMAWQTLRDRKDPAVTKTLKADLASGTISDARAIQSLWVLGDPAPETAAALRASQNRNIRRELARHPAQAMELLADADAEVRFAALATLGRQLPDNAEQILPKLVASVGPSIKNGPTATDSRTGKPIPAKEAYEREFERFLVRFFLERHPNEVAAFLDSDAAAGLSLEGRSLAALALPPKTSASLVAATLPKLDRAPNTEELLRLAQYPDAPGCGDALAALLANPISREAVSKQLLQQSTRINPTKVATLLTEAARTLLQGDGDGVGTALKLASAFSLTELEPEIVAFVKKPDAKPEARLSGLAALRQLRSKEIDLFASILGSSAENASVRDAALEALAASPNPQASQKLVGLYANFSISQRRTALAGLSSSKTGAQALVAAIKDNKIPATDLDSATAERLSTVLAKDPDLATLMNSLDHVFGEVLRFDGTPSAFVNAPFTLKGPFTVETWVRLAPGINNADSILASDGALDINFSASTFRVWAGPEIRDVALSKQPVAAELWTHLAVTRDAKGTIKIYTDGELDALGSKKAPAAFSDLKIGWSHNKKEGTKGALAEYRVWDRERSATEIRKNFDRRFGDAARPKDLIFYNPGGDASWGKLGKGVAVAKTSDLPPLMTHEEAAELDTKFAKYMELGRKGGNIANGKALSALCTSCHVMHGQGGQIGPDISGAAAMGLEGVLRNILTPNAAMESGYRIYRVEMKTGEIIDAFFVSEDNDAVVIRQIGLPDRRIAKREIARTQFIRRSLMPEGLLDALSDQQAADLLAYLMNGTPTKVDKKTAPAPTAASTAAPTAAPAAESKPTAQPYGRQQSATGIKHSFIIAGNPTVLVGEDGLVKWQVPGKARDAFGLPNGNILATINNRAQEFTREGKVVWSYQLGGGNKELGTAVRLSNGNTLVVERGVKPRLLEITPSGKVAVEVPLQPETDNAHMQTRMARKLPNGNYLVPHLLAFKIKEYQADGTVVREINTDLPELGGREQRNWPFTAIRLKNGNTLVNLTNGNKTAEFDKDGKVVWKLTNDDVGGRLADPCGGQRLANGNTIICSYGQKDPKKVKILEVTPDKKVVWEFFHPKVRAHEVHVLTTNGQAEGALK